jgi:hypothetical protein
VRRDLGVNDRLLNSRCIHFRDDRILKRPGWAEIKIKSEMFRHEAVRPDSTARR